MTIAKEDMIILRSSEIYELYDKYRQKFGEEFMGFDYADFPGTPDKSAGQMYKETLEKALQDDKPYHIKSRRYEFSSFFDEDTTE